MTTNDHLRDPDAIAALVLARLYSEVELDSFLAGYYESLLDPRRASFARAHNLARWTVAYDYCMRAFSDSGRPRLLDFGCGVGTHSLALAACGMEVLGVDLSVDAIQCARHRSEAWRTAGLIAGDVTFEIGSGVTTDSTGSQFDVVLFHESLAHVGERSMLWEAIVARLRPGGLVVIAESNALNPAVRLGNRRRRMSGQLGVLDSRYVHKSLRSSKRLRKELDDAGIHVLSTRYIGFSPGMLWRTAPVAARRLERVASRTPLVRQLAVSFTLVGRA